jgi:hypothetical protein
MGTEISYFIYLCVVYLPTLIVVQTLKRKIKVFMNSELERMWKEAVVA